MSVSRLTRTRRAAGVDAASRAVEGRSASLLIVFCSDSHDLEQLLAGINEISGNAPLIGRSTAGEIATGGPADLSVVVTALGGEGFSVATAAASLEGERLSEGGAAVASCLSHVADREHQVLLADGRSGGDQQEIVRGAYSVAGAGVALVGGCAGDDLKMMATAQLHGSQVLTNSSWPPRSPPTGHSGWCPARLASGRRADGGHEERRRPRVLLDGEPALDVYLFA